MHLSGCMDGMGDRPARYLVCGISDGMWVHCIHRINIFTFHDTQKIQGEKRREEVTRKWGKRKEEEGDTPALYTIALHLYCVALPCIALPVFSI
jgi:hypothetical protein